MSALGLHRLAFLGACLAALSLSPACANTTGMIITGESMLTLEQAVEVGNARMVEASAAGKVTRAQVEAWNSFQDKFQLAYPPAVELWRTGRKVNDLAIQNRAGEILGALLAEFVPLGQVVGVSIQDYLARADGGAP